MKISRRLSALVLAILIFNPLGAYADTVAGLKVTNNLDRNIDYKLDKEAVEKLTGKVPSKSNHTEVFDEDAGRNITENNKELSYLIEKNIISRENNISIGATGVSVDNGNINNTGDMNKSHFLIGVYKSIYGPISSRPLIVNTPSLRETDGESRQMLTTTTKPKGYEGKDNKFEYKEGDYHTFTSSNVIELYLSELLNKSIIEPGQLEPEVLDELKSRGSQVKPAWDNSLPGYVIGKPDSGNASGGTPLGKFFPVPDYPNTSSSCSIGRNNDAQYFVNEKVSTLESLRLIEDILRLTEKDLSKTEADLVSYKFGTSYILDFPEETRDTITYLIAMGVLDFEQPGEFGNIYDDLSNEFAHKLMYRLHNKSGRKDFSKIQLTDSEDQLLKAGFIEQKLTNTEEFDGVMPKTSAIYKDGEEVLDAPETEGGSLDEVTQPSVEMTMKEDGVINTVLTAMGFERQDRGLKFATGDGTNRTFEVVKLFTDEDNTRYKGVRIQKLATDEASRKQFDEIKGVPKLVSGEEGQSVEITFTIKAPSEVQALASIDSRITITSNSANIKGNVNTITQVVRGGKKTSFISSKELGNVASEIAVLNSKTLKNKVTGDTAMLLRDHKLALVGNTVISSQSNMVERINGTEYYNLDMVIPLMTNTYISKIDPTQLYTKVKLPKDEVIPVKGTGGILEYVPIVKLGEKTEPNPLIEKGIDKYYYNINLLTKGVSTLIRDFEVGAEGKKVPVTIIINWNYSLPKTKQDGKLIEDAHILKESKKEGEQFSIQNATNYLYTRPESGELQDWWDNNIELSNALANVMYNTTDKPVRYIKSGYLSPNIEILAPDPKITEDAIVRSVFGDMKLPATYVNKFLKGDIRNFHKILFNKTTDDLNGRREFHVYRAKPAGQGSIISYADRYVKYPTGAIYKRVFDDSRFKFVIEKDKKFIDLHGRAKETMTKISPNSVVVNVNGSKRVMYFSGYSGDDKNGNYIRLVDPEPVQGKAVKIESTGEYTVKEGNIDKIDEYIKKWQEIIPEGLMRSAKDMTPKVRTMPAPKDKYKHVPGKYVVFGDLKEVKKSSSSESGLAVGATDDDSGDVYAYPAIFLDRSSFKFKELSGAEIVKDEDNKMSAKYELVMERTNPFLESSNVFYSGLNSSLISRILAEDSSTVNISKLPAGARVVIQDVMYTKNGGQLVSDPIGPSERATTLADAYLGKDKATAISKEVLMLFQGLAMDYSGRKETFTGDKKENESGVVPFSSYIEEAGLGPLLDQEKADNTLYKSRSSAMIAVDKDTRKNLTSKDMAKTAVISIVPDKNVLFRLIDRENKVYELVTQTDRFAEGYIDDVSMFYETLDLSSNDDLFLALQGNTFSPLEGRDGFINEFLFEYSEALKSDAENVLKYWLTFGLSYAIVISWIGFAILGFDLGKNILLSFREITENQRSKGFDIIKLFTCGILNLDMELKASQVFLGDLVLFVLLYAVLLLI